MKYIIYIGLLFLFACEKYDIPQTYDFDISVYYPDSLFNAAPLPNATIEIVNKQTGRKYSQFSDENGNVHFEVRGGLYDISVSSKQNYLFEIDGKPTYKDILFHETVFDRKILAATQLTLQTTLTILNSGFVISEFYNSGSRTPEGESYSRDQFIEIYNNSDITLFADGLCFGNVWYKNTYTPNPLLNPDGSFPSDIACWSYIAVIPGSGTDYPIDPGESFVIAQSAINHRDDPNGNPNSIDLSGSDFELFIEDGRYVDNPGVANANMIQVHERPFANVMVFNVHGQSSIIFRIPDNNFQAFFGNAENYIIATGSTDRCVLVPDSWIIDGIENPELNPTVYKRLPNNIDSGYIQHRGKGEKVSIKRKVQKVVDGRVILMDTNNSSNDFLTNQEPTPGIIESE
ncbi:DUF4876 domain-containing protein [Draconibacterium sp. IB214405]|uniref:DUF4876 domain-containing protein n=1 Tax=Draconibacterium sp. IB214405 TaxID=3097352 RepID=UPI002A0B0DDD|nr:DUF4876 domain-containing protein [Draconibacterium sp. IB214405]MDX8340004.1 DUF4876 domain-containing protein [Draconibacterium sp. IB214405]